MKKLVRNRINLELDIDSLSDDKYAEGKEKIVIKDWTKPILRGKSKKLLKLLTSHAILIETNCEGNQSKMSES